MRTVCLNNTCGYSKASYRAYSGSLLHRGVTQILSQNPGAAAGLSLSSAEDNRTGVHHCMVSWVYMCGDSAKLKVLQVFFKEDYEDSQMVGGAW